jgi:hypothetical protein
MTTGSPASTMRAGFTAVRPSDEHPTGLDLGAGLGPALGQTPPYQFGVEAAAQR